MPHAIFPPGIESTRILFSAQNAILKRQLVNCAKYATPPSSTFLFQCWKMSMRRSLKQQQRCVQHNWQLFLFLFLFLIFSFLGGSGYVPQCRIMRCTNPKIAKKRRQTDYFFICIARWAISILFYSLFRIHFPRGIVNKLQESKKDEYLEAELVQIMNETEYGILYRAADDIDIM